MMRSLYSAVSGLKTHQTRMDVIGNNIANVNTEAFKSSSVTFSEIMYQTTSSASAGNGATGVGGINAKQIGLGVATGATQMSITTAGAAETTGNPFDLKLTDSQTTNFFVVNDGNSNLFTRAGSFYVDGNGYLCMTSTGYTLMGWQVDPTTGQIKKDTVSSLQVMSPANQTSSPESTEKAYISGVLDKNDTNLASVDGYTTSMLFYDDLGYAYTARFNIKPTDRDKGAYSIELDDILDQNSKSIFAEGATYSNVNIRDLFGTTTSTKIGEDIDEDGVQDTHKLSTITDPNDQTQYANLKVGTIVYNTADEQYYAITEKTPATYNQCIMPASSASDAEFTYNDEDDISRTKKIYEMFGVLPADVASGKVVVKNLDKATGTVKMYTRLNNTASGSTINGYTQNADGTLSKGGITYTYDANTTQFNGSDGSTVSIAAILGIDTAKIKDGTELNDGLYIAESYRYEPSTPPGGVGSFYKDETRTIANSDDVTNLAKGKYYIDKTSGYYYYVTEATTKTATVAEMKDFNSKGEGYFSYVDGDKTISKSIASAFGFTASDDTSVAIDGQYATGATLSTTFPIVFNVSDGTLNYVVMDGQDYANISASILGENFKDIRVDFSKMLNYNNGGTSTVKMIRGDTTGDGAGKKLGALTGITVDNAGKIYGSYDNGNTVLLCQIAVAQFSNASGLEKVGENCYQTTLNSGEFDGIGIEVNADGSSINTGELEMSNVDLSAEFTSMIVTQRGFQANSRVITTSDTLLEELINLKR